VWASAGVAVPFWFVVGVELILSAAVRARSGSCSLTIKFFFLGGLVRTMRGDDYSGDQ
jgi:hypothetical protein